MTTARRLKVVILSSGYGGGHNRVSEVLAQELRQASPGCHVEIYDYFETCVGHHYNRLLTALYFVSVRRLPWLYRWFYRVTSTIAVDSLPQRYLNGLGRSRLAALLRTHRPDLVVCTYPTPAGVMSALKAQGGVDLPCVTIITDHTAHSQWVHPHVDLYLVSSEYVREGLIARGVPPRRVLATGIPIAPRFARPPHRQALRRKYRLNPSLPTVLAMVGAYNLLRGALEVYRRLADLPRAVQLLCVCGRDAGLRRAVEDLARKARRPMRVFGYVQEIPELMAASDLLVSKAGGVTTSEALAAELPMVVVNPIPGQEEENVAFLQRVGAAVSVPRVADLRAVIGALLADPERLARLRAGARQVKRPEAAADAVAAMLALAHRQDLD